MLFKFKYGLPCRFRIRLIPLMIIAVLVASCGSTSWHTENREVRGDVVAISLSGDLSVVSSTAYVPEEIVAVYRESALDSLMQASFSRYVSGMSRGGLINASYSASPAEAGVLLVVEEVQISRTYSIDFVLRGPVIRTRMQVAAYRGSEKIFETRVSASQNMAYTARNDRRFYWMNEEERNNPDYQKAALLSASATALGEAYRRFFRQ
jgi:hypothetical protein